MTPNPKNPAFKAREKKQRASLKGWRREGTQTAAAKAGGVCDRTISNWYRAFPEYREQVDAAIDEYATTVGQRTHAAIGEHVDAARRGEMVLVKQGTEGGKPVEIYERVALNPALARLALTRADPRFTHPKQELEHSNQRITDEAVAEAHRMLKESQDRREAEGLDPVVEDAIRRMRDTTKL